MSTFPRVIKLFQIFLPGPVSSINQYKRIDASLFITQGSKRQPKSTRIPSKAPKSTYLHIRKISRLLFEEHYFKAKCYICITSTPNCVKPGTEVTTVAESLVKQVAVSLRTHVVSASLIPHPLPLNTSSYTYNTSSLTSITTTTVVSLAVV